MFCKGGKEGNIWGYLIPSSVAFEETLRFSKQGNIWENIKVSDISPAIFSKPIEGCQIGETLEKTYQLRFSDVLTLSL
jgi:hypothetical protein